MSVENMNEKFEQSKELIKIIFQDDRPAVLARDLYEFLEVGSDYRHWFPRMCEYGFTEGQDFNPVKIDRVQQEGNRMVSRTVDDAAVSIDMAKEISMLQRNEKGKIARRYFIQLEKDWNSPDKVMARALLFAQKKINSLEAKIEADAPAVAFANEIALSKDAATMGNYAKSLFNKYGIKIGRNRLFEFLRDMKILQSDNIPYQKYIENGWFQVQPVFKNGNLYYQTLICGKGQQKVYELIKAKYFNGRTLEEGNALLEGM